MKTYEFVMKRLEAVQAFIQDISHHVLPESSVTMTRSESEGWLVSAVDIRPLAKKDHHWRTVGGIEFRVASDGEYYSQPYCEPWDKSAFHYRCHQCGDYMEATGQHGAEMICPHCEPVAYGVAERLRKHLLFERRI